MYNEYFGLKEIPFTISPDPRYLFMSERHRDALAHLVYGVGSGGGFVLLTGEVGTGKTTVCRCLLEQLPDNVRLAFILNPKLNSVELMATMCDELGIFYDKKESSLKVFTDLLSDYLVKSNQKNLNTVLMIDEAQNLTVEVLEQIRLLTNLETNQKKLLQIILIGQPELQELLAKKELRQLAQRITARYHLRPLSIKETKAYMEHRLRIAGVSRPIFKSSAVQHIHRASQGIPRLINVICDRSLLGAFSEHKTAVDVKTVKKAVDEVLGHNARPLAQERFQNRSDKLTSYMLPVFGVALLGMASIFFWKYLSEEQAVSNPKIVGQQENSKGSIVSKEVLQKTPAEVDIEKIAQKFWQDQSWDRSGVIAAKNLFALWGISYLPFQSAESCTFAQNYSLSCDSGMANWQFLEKLNRPANLKFSTNNTGDFWGTLVSLNSDIATLQFGDNQIRINKKELNPLWTGEYQLLWKQPLGFAGQLSVGGFGQNVEWLTNSIEAIDRSDFSPRNRFTTKVEKWVKEFQLAQGLVADGVIGKHTVIMINNFTIENIPQLEPIPNDSVQEPSPSQLNVILKGSGE